jgi:hypothetical protein
MPSVPIYSPGSGFAQGIYKDQMGTQLPGMLANASDINLCDAVYLDATTALDAAVCAGSFVFVKYVAGANAARQGANSMQATVVSGTAVPTGQSFGVVVKNQQMYTNKFGQQCAPDGRQCNVLRADRVGGRVWVFAKSAALPAVGARSAFIVPDTATYGVSAIATTNTGCAINNIIVHAIDSGTVLYPGPGLVLALVEFTTS